MTEPKTMPEVDPQRPYIWANKVKELLDELAKPDGHATGTCCDGCLTAFFILSKDLIHFCPNCGSEFSHRFDG